MSLAEEILPRAEAMRLLALSSWDDVKTHTEAVAAEKHDFLRQPETGLIMLRGRMGSTGAAFNVGEATITRCAVRLATTGTEGHAYVLGRNADHALRAAICDALYQSEPKRLLPALKALSAKLHTKQQTEASKAAATKVDFFTLVRGDD